MQRSLMKSLLEWKNSPHRKPLLLKGARQVGKTYLLKEFGQKAFPKVHYINFERDSLASIFEPNFKTSRILTELSFFLGQSINPEDLLIFDEIQACPRAISSLKYFQEEMPSLALAAAGSLLGVSLSSEAFPVGKVDWLSLYPLTFSEFLLGIGEGDLHQYLISLSVLDREMPNLSVVAHERLWERLKHYFIVGGLPEIVSLFAEHQNDLFTAFQKVRERQESLIRDYYSDIAKHSGKVNAMHIDRLWRSIPAQLFKVHEGTSQRFRFKDIVPGIDRFSRLANVVDWLLNAGLILKSEIVKSAQMPLSAYAQEGVFKLFIFDVGILGAMSGLTPKALLDYSYGTYKGYFAENFVAQSLVSSGQFPALYTWQEGTAEIEFIQETQGEVIPIEVKSGTVTHAKSLSQFKKKYSPSYSVIYSGKNLFIDENSMTHFLPLYLAGLLKVKN